MKWKSRHVSLGGTKDPYERLRRKGYSKHPPKGYVKHPRKNHFVREKENEDEEEKNKREQEIHDEIIQETKGDRSCDFDAVAKKKVVASKRKDNGGESIDRGKKRCVSSVSSCDNLPAGWNMHVVSRAKKGGKIRKDHFYISPGGRRFRSLKSARASLVVDDGRNDKKAPRPLQPQTKRRRLDVAIIGLT